MMRLIFKNIPMNAELEWQGGKGARRLRGKEARRQGGKEAKKPSCHLAILPSFPSPNSELRIPNSAIGMVKVHLMLISLLLLCVISGTIADGQQSFTYPKPDGEVRNFDDENPIWGPGQALSFERSYKSGSGGQGIYWYQPFGENKPCFPLAVQEEGLSIDFGQSKQSKFFASYFSWVGTDISTYRFVYTQLPDIYWGKFTLLGS
jgi:hypothetical protein